jgi:hypothetical protein
VQSLRPNFPSDRGRAACSVTETGDRKGYKTLVVEEPSHNMRLEIGIIALVPRIIDRGNLQLKDDWICGMLLT